MSATPQHTAVLALGGNLGNRHQWLKKATDAIAALSDTQITARSSIYETTPIDVPEEFKKQAFLNSVVIVETKLTARELSEAIHNIEDQLQRKRTKKNAPRTIDIDIITFDDVISDHSELTLPHPRAHQRGFVLHPLAEINPDFVLPNQTLSVSELIARNLNSC